MVLARSFLLFQLCIRRQEEGEFLPFYILQSLFRSVSHNLKFFKVNSKYYFFHSKLVIRLCKFLKAVVINRKGKFRFEFIVPWPLYIVLLLCGGLFLLLLTWNSKTDVKFLELDNILTVYIGLYNVARTHRMICFFLFS